jgi:hypothetical protein
MLFIVLSLLFDLDLLFGHPSQGGNWAEKLHLIDFGLATYYRDPVSQLHRPRRERQKMVGMVHYAAATSSKE